MKIGEVYEDSDGIRYIILSDLKFNGFKIVQFPWNGNENVFFEKNQKKNWKKVCELKNVT